MKATEFLKEFDACIEHSKHDCVNDGWVESERCPECGAENTVQANPFQVQ